MNVSTSNGAVSTICSHIIDQLESGYEKPNTYFDCRALLEEKEKETLEKETQTFQVSHMAF
jgi:hypothetical protein